MQPPKPIGTSFTPALIRFVAENKYRWLRHALFILLGPILAFKGDIGVPNQYRSPEVMRTVLLVDGVSFIFILSLLYLMILVLIPRLLFRNKSLLFGISIFMVITLIYFGVWLLDYYFLRPVNPGNMQHIELSVMHFVQIGPGEPAFPV